MKFQLSYFRYQPLKLILISLVFSVLVSIFLPVTQSQSREIDPLESKNEITLVDIRNRDIKGNFYNLNLENSLAENGRLWNLLEAQKSKGGKLTWFIDPMLIEEIQDLGDGFSTVDGENYPASVAAQNWLSGLTEELAGGEVVALNYGNPPISWLNNSAPTERRIHLNLSRQRLSELLSREISDREPRISTDIPRLSPFLTENYSDLRREIKSINRYAKNSVTRDYRLTVGSILNQNFDPDLAKSFVREFQVIIERYKRSVRIGEGKFTLTSERERIPLTLINDFTNDITVVFQTFPSNSKIVVGKIDRVTIPADSKLFLTLPVQVLTSGSSEVLITLRTPSGVKLGDEVRLPLTLTVISPLTTWITTGSGIILLFAAVIQSLRRIRKSKKKSISGVDHE
jgi:hypothetical protein